MQEIAYNGKLFKDLLNYKEVGITMEKTFLMIKPDGVGRGLIGEIVKRIENKGIKVVGAKLMTVSEDLAKTHYGEHSEKPFFGELVEFIARTCICYGT